MSIIGIVAVDKNNAIGKGGKLPWHYSADMKFFKQQTIGNVCVMGHRTWLSIMKPLPNRLNVVLSRTSDLESHDSLIVMRDRESTLALKSYLSCHMFIMGGAQVYKTFQNDIDKWIVTQVPLAIDGADAHMPDGFLNGFAAMEEKLLEEDLRVTSYERR